MRKKLCTSHKLCTWKEVYILLKFTIKIKKENIINFWSFFIYSFIYIIYIYKQLGFMIYYW